MKKIIAIGTVLLMLGLAACGGQKEMAAAAPTVVETVASEQTTASTATEIQRGNPAFTAFTAEDTDGNAVNQEIFGDCKVTMINLWGTFCGPCIREMPDLGELNREFEDRDFQIVGIVLDVTDRNMNPVPDAVANAKQIIESTGADYRHLIPSKDLFDAYLSGVQFVPETIFVDAEGYQIGESYVGSRDKAEWSAIITEMLESVQ